MLSAIWEGFQNTPLIWRLVLGAIVGAFIAGTIPWLLSYKPTALGLGGLGGRATANDGGAARGGRGGAGGDQGPGGQGGDAHAQGVGSFALGGEGGEGARSDRAAKGGRGPMDVLDHPDKDMIVPGTNMRLGDFGKGGDGGFPTAKR